SGTITSAAPFIAAVYSDAGTGVDLARLTLTLDGASVLGSAFVTGSSASFTSGALTQGSHTLAAAIADVAGNVASANSSFLVDSIAPVTSLQIDGQTTAASSFVLITT